MHQYISIYIEQKYVKINLPTRELTSIELINIHLIN